MGALFHAQRIGVAVSVLNSSHRCDSCDSRAYVAVVLKWSPKLKRGGELLFCAHHARRHLEALAPLVSVVIDERDQLTEHVKDDGHVN